MWSVPSHRLPNVLQLGVSGLNVGRMLVGNEAVIGPNISAIDLFLFLFPVEVLVLE